jgi:hypothetical protein
MFQLCLTGMHILPNESYRIGNAAKSSETEVIQKAVLCDLIPMQKFSANGLANRVNEIV